MIKINSYIRFFYFVLFSTTLVVCMSFDYMYTASYAITFLISFVGGMFAVYHHVHSKSIIVGGRVYEIKEKIGFLKFIFIYGFCLCVTLFTLLASGYPITISLVVQGVSCCTSLALILISIWSRHESYLKAQADILKKLSDGELLTPDEIDLINQRQLRRTYTPVNRVRRPHGLW
ncbi:hypothetical protein ACX3OY_23380 [Citrobacter farmeri]